MIIIKNKFGNIAMDLDTTHATIRLSGGFDSTVLLYTLASEIKKNKKDITIIPITVIKDGNERSTEGLQKFNPSDTVRNVVNFVRSSFPDVKIEDPKFITVTDWWINNTEVHIDAQENLIFNIKKERNLKKVTDYNGVTKNPSVVIGREIFEERDNNGKLTFVNRNPEKHRNVFSGDSIKDTVSAMHQEHGVVFMAPFRNFDKRITFKLADEHGILDFVLNNTRSCEGRKKRTNNFATTCIGPDICWWCYEREWGLKNYNKD